MAEIETIKEQILSKQSIESIMPYLEQMGFKFTESKRFPNLIGVSIPENFTAKTVRDTKEVVRNNKPGERNFHRELFREERIVVIDFFDEFQTKRGSFIINKTNMNGSTICLEKRLNIHQIKHQYNVEMYFGTPELKLFTLSSVSVESGSTMYIESNKAKIREQLKALATEYYPEWKNPAAYWELTEDELIAMLPQQEQNATLNRKNNK